MLAANKIEVIKSKPNPAHDLGSIVVVEVLKTLQIFFSSVTPSSVVVNVRPQAYGVLIFLDRVVEY